MPVGTQTPEQIGELSRSISAIFEVTYDKYLARQDIWFQDMKFDETINNRIVTLPWFEDVYGIREGIPGQAIAKQNMQGHYHEVALRKFETGLQINILDAESNSMARINNRVTDITAKAARHQQDLMIEKLELGDTSAVKTWDDENWFSTTHTKQGGNITFSNLYTLGAFSETTFEAARLLMMQIPSDEGTAHPLGLLPTDIIVPIGSHVAASRLMNHTWVPGGAGEGENIYKGMARVRTDPRLTDPDDWYLVVAEGAIKPFMYIKHSKYGNPALIPNFEVNNEAFKDREVLEWWLRFYAEMAPTRPEWAAKIEAP